MSAQGGSITGRVPLQLPIRFVALLLAAVTAAAVSVAAIQTIGQEANEDTAVAEVDGYWGGAIGHPAIRHRVGVRDASAVPVQRLYPDGFGVRDASAVPVQRLYPDGFGAPVDDDDDVPILDGVRRKWS